ncbi:MAG: hypothetical protein BIFFINMI_02588 [Phycisphaerae bacterium]|nr:hypothetical protein [Phycisphaerae bacterium]
MRMSGLMLTLAAALGAAAGVRADDDAATTIPAEFRIKRQAEFDFVARPTLTRSGDRTTIAFQTRGLCDVTVAVEDSGGRILRHLACGVLGPNAPAPLLKGSTKQTLVWDGKDDQGHYVDADGVQVRVSLGLQARFERTLYWSGNKRTGDDPLIVCPAPEGVYVFDRGGGVSQLRLYDHQGDYLRTVYPFPADGVKSFEDLHWLDFPQDGRRLPRKNGHRQCTLLTGGTDSEFSGTMGSGLKHTMPDPATGMAVGGNRIALLYERLNRLTTDGSAEGGRLQGAKTGVPLKRSGLSWRGGEDDIQAGPRSVAFSPDGRTLYMTAYSWMQNWGTGGFHEGWLNGVGRVAFDGPEAAKAFAGNLRGEDAGGTGEGQFRTPAWVTCDAQGRVYVADNGNDRIQVFTADGKFLKAIPVAKPVCVAVHPKTGRIYVLSWLIRSKAITFHNRREEIDKTAPTPRLIELAGLDDPRQLASWDLGQGRDLPSHGYAIDVWTDPVTVWVTPGDPGMYRGWERAGLCLLQPDGGRMAVRRDFGRLAIKEAARAWPAPYLRQRLYVNPVSGRLFVAEADAGVGKSLSELLEIDPATGAISRVEMPFDAEDMAFDPQGLVCLRARNDIGRYDPKDWREVPWDYGEARKGVGFASSKAEGPGKKVADIASSLRIPSQRYNHHGGMMVNARGDIVVSIHGGQETERMQMAAKDLYASQDAYHFRLYPGRCTQGLILVFDKYGKILFDDALPGIAFTHGVGIDRDDNVYAMAMAFRVIDGKPYYDEATDTLLKVRPGQAKVYSPNAKMTPVPLTPEVQPKRGQDLVGNGGARIGRAWVEGAQWFYGGVGYTGRHSQTDGFGCDCSNSRFDMDYFARSFAPEVEHCSVAVLDASGNLIMRIGTYGNVDDGRPIEPGGGPPATRSIGGDEVALFYAPYVAVQTDRRLFVADPGNARVVSVKLSYHTDERVKLPEASGPAKSN